LVYGIACLLKQLSSSVDILKRNLDRLGCNQDTYYNYKSTVARTENTTIVLY